MGDDKNTTNIDAVSKELRSYILNEMYEKRYTQAGLADELDISQNTFSSKLSNGNFTFIEIVKLFEIFDTDVGTINKIIKGYGE